MYDDVGITWGLGIVLITFISRLVVLPLTLRSMHGMRELQALQPHMKELQEKYKDDRQRLQREQMALFQEHGVNPLSSCLPLLLQIPVFFALYNLLNSQSFKDQLEAAGITTEQIDLWVNEDDLLVKKVEKADTANGAMEFVANYSEYGVDVQVEVPPESDTLDFQDAMGQ